MAATTPTSQASPTSKGEVMEVLSIAEMNEAIKSLQDTLAKIKSMMDYAKNKTELAEVQLKLKDDSLWDDPNQAKVLGQREARLQEAVAMIDEFAVHINDTTELLELLDIESNSAEGSTGKDNTGKDNSGEEILQELSTEINRLLKETERIEYESMFNHPHDAGNCFVEIQSGQGGTEAQDWAEMLLRMYIKWADAHNFTSEVLEVSNGDVAGIKGASIRLVGRRAYGWSRTETGIHRLVRKSPFNSGNKRHTSFASVFVTPEIDATIEVDIETKDLRIDTYRASGAGGQHVNKTDSAVRITHIPTGVVVQCQNQRSQHQNKDKALKQLRSKLYLLEEEKNKQEKLKLEDAKDAISWGHQIRSYVLDDSRIKDLRTGVEKSDCPRVLNGDLDDFILACLQQRASEVRQ